MRLLPLVVLAVGSAYASHLPHPPIFTAVQHYPSICYLPPDSAMCDSANKIEDSAEMDLLTRYYFDVTTEACYPFSVQSCGGNENRFPTRSDCMQYCKIVKRDDSM